MNIFKLTLLMIFTTVPAHGMLCSVARAIPNMPKHIAFTISGQSEKGWNVGSQTFKAEIVGKNPFDFGLFKDMPVADPVLRKEMLKCCFGADLFDEKQFDQLTEQTKLISPDFLLRFAHDARNEAKANKSAVTIVVVQHALEKNREIYEAGVAGEAQRRELLQRQQAEAIIFANMPVADPVLRKEMLKRCFGADTFSDEQFDDLTEITQRVSPQFLLKFASKAATHARENPRWEPETMKKNRQMLFDVVKNDFQKDGHHYELRYVVEGLSPH